MRRRFGISCLFFMLLIAGAVTFWFIYDQWHFREQIRNEHREFVSAVESKDVATISRILDHEVRIDLPKQRTTVSSEKLVSILVSDNAEILSTMTVSLDVNIAGQIAIVRSHHEQSIRIPSEEYPRTRTFRLKCEYVHREDKWLIWDIVFTPGSLSEIVEQ